MLDLSCTLPLLKTLLEGRYHSHLEMRKQRPREGLKAKPLTLIALVLSRITQHSTSAASSREGLGIDGKILQSPDIILSPAVTWVLK